MISEVSNLQPFDKGLKIKLAGISKEINHKIQPLSRFTTSAEDSSQRVGGSRRVAIGQGHGLNFTQD